MENNELDLITFENEDGTTATFEVLDYFFYEGTQYAVLTEYLEDEEFDEEETLDCFIMKVEPVGEDEEAFLPIEDEELEEKLIEIYEQMGDDDEYDFEDA